MIEGFNTQELIRQQSHTEYLCNCNPDVSIIIIQFLIRLTYTQPFNFVFLRKWRVISLALLLFQPALLWRASSDAL